MGFFGMSFNRATEATELHAPFKIKMCEADFVNFRTEILFKKILHRVYSRSEGMTDEQKIASISDSTEKSSAPRGLITLLSLAMTQQKEIGLIYKAGVVREATSDEKEQLKKDYEKNAKSSVGVLVDFSKYKMTDLVKAYMSMIFDILSSMNTQVGLAKALQVKISKLRGTVSAVGKDDPVTQAKEINNSLKKGNSVLLDKEDAVETLKLDAESVEKAFNFVCSLLASDLGVSLSFITGALTTGMSATGEADSNADEYGFQDFFTSIFKPVCDNLYGWDLRFITDDWRYFNAMIGNLMIVENSSLLSDEQKRAYADRLMPIKK